MGFIKPDNKDNAKASSQRKGFSKIILRYVKMRQFPRVFTVIEVPS
ncbi:hypothetical protein RRSWK_02587 [Rhodopirellula sp. SWK7]|nr:hypothetical protein RRSWK_02587 [Rhodopirellula sp. SWK7]